MPTLIPSGATALEVIADALVAAGLGVEGSTLWLGVELDGDLDRAAQTVIPDAACFVTEGDGLPHLTMGLAVALEVPTVTVVFRGAPGDYTGPKQKALRARYEVASLKEYTSRGLTLLNANPLGSLLPLGADPNGRHRFSVKFNATTTPSYQ